MRYCFTKYHAYHYFQKILSIIVFLALSNSTVISQVTADSYKNQKLPDKRVIIAPNIIMDSVGFSFRKEFPEIKAPDDSLKKLFAKNLNRQLRKYGNFYSIYCSPYKEVPELKLRHLNLSGKESFEMLLPSDSQSVKMNLMGLKPEDPDFILFIQIGSIEYTNEITMGPSIGISNFANVTAGFNLSKVEGIILKNIKYAYWDNKTGCVAVFNQKSLFLDKAKDAYDKDDLFSTESKYLGTVARYLLTKTPFSNPDMPYYVY